MTHSSIPLSSLCLDIILDISLRMEETKDGSENMFTSTQKDVGAELVVARKRVDISILAISSAVRPHFWEQSSRELMRVLAVV